MKTLNTDIQNRGRMSNIHPVGFSGGDENQNEGNTKFNQKIEKKFLL